MEDLYLAVAQAIFWTALLLMAVRSLLWQAGTLRRPVVLPLPVPPLRRIVPMLLGLGMVAGLAGAAALGAALGLIPQLVFFNAVGMVILGLLALVVLPWAHRIDAELPRRPWAGGRLGILSATALGSVVVLGGSLVYLIVAQRTVGLTARPEFEELYATVGGAIILAGLAVVAALFEEVLFRLGLQSWFERLMGPRRGGRLTALVLTSAVFALGHTGIATPTGFKELQIFGVALVLGALKNGYGLRACVAAHLALNVGSIAIELVWQLFTA